jgi:hypothetical protein
VWDLSLSRLRLHTVHETVLEQACITFRSFRFGCIAILCHYDVAYNFVQRLSVEPLVTFYRALCWKRTKYTFVERSIYVQLCTFGGLQT